MYFIEGRLKRATANKESEQKRSSIKGLLKGYFKSFLLLKGYCEMKNRSYAKVSLKLSQRLDIIGCWFVNKCRAKQIH